MDKNSIDKANELIFDSLLTLVKCSNSKLTFEQKEQINLVIDNLEEVRHLLYELRNELHKNVA